MKLSVVATLYQSALYIEEFCRRVRSVAQQFADEDYEIILVNDGSPDNSLDISLELHDRDAHLRVVDLSRNFGHHKAMMTGLKQSRGEYVFLIDSDLEEEPEWLTRFADIMQREKCDVVYGVQSRRKGNLFERWSGKCFYYILNQLVETAIPENLVTARLMTRRYVHALIQHNEREIFMAGLWHTTGFDQRPCVVVKHSHSPTTYSLRHKFIVLVNSISSFSNAPLIYIFYIGILISMFAGGYIASLVVNYYTRANPLMGWTSTVASIWLVGGIIITSLGLIGIYVARIYSEVKNRPYTIIRKMYEKPYDQNS